MSDIFISYAREDRKKIEALAKGFENQGWSVWWDRKIPPGKTFSQVIVEELAEARCVVVAWSKQSVKSNWVQEEADEGLKKGILIPVIIEDVLLPMGFRRIQAVDLIKWDPAEASQNFQFLIKNVAQILAQPPSTKLSDSQQAEMEPPLPDVSAKPFTSKKIGQSELASILEKHSRWIKSGSEEGQQADFANADLSGLDLTDADLAKADLTGANLSKANLHSANLTEAILTKTNLKNSNLSNATLKDALLLETYFRGANLAGVIGLDDLNLSGADFEGASGLLSTDFARSDLTRAKLPEDVGNFNTLNLIEEASKSARKIFYALIIVGAFSWLIIAKTTDVGLFTNTSSMYLPIVGDQFLTQPLYMFVPLILISIYVFFHLYMQRNWESMGTLPAIFPDGTSLPKKMHRWFLNCFVRRNFRILKKQRSLTAKLEEGSAILIGWWAVPVTLMGFWVRYLPRRDWTGTALHIIFFLAALAAALGFYQYANLGLAQFSGADLEEVDLHDADLRCAKLAGAKNLTAKKLSTVKTLYKADLDAILLNEIENKMPHLLETPAEQWVELNARKRCP